MKYDARLQVISISDMHITAVSCVDQQHSRFPKGSVSVHANCLTVYTALSRNPGSIWEQIHAFIVIFLILSNNVDSKVL